MQLDKSRPEVVEKIEKYLGRYSTETFQNISDLNILATITRFKHLCAISDTGVIEDVQLNSGEMMAIDMEIGMMLDDMEKLGVPEAIKLNNESKLRNKEMGIEED